MRWRCWVLAGALLGLSLGAQATTPREAQGASVDFPGPTGYIEARQGGAADPQHWSQKAPAWDDPDRVMSFTVVRPSWWLKRLMALGPEAMLLRLTDRLVAVAQRPYDPEGGAEVDYDYMHINGHPALEIALERQDVPPGAQATLITLPRHVRSRLLWTGEGFVMATVTGSREVLDDDPFLASLTTRTAGVPGDVDAQWDRICQLGGVVVLVLLLAIGGAIYGIDKGIQRRRRRQSRTIGVV